MSGTSHGLMASDPDFLRWTPEDKRHQRFRDRHRVRLAKEARERAAAKKLREGK